MVNIITGDQNDNFLNGTYEDDILRGLGGNDMLMGGPGNDTLEGGTGNDYLHGMEGNNTYLFGRGDGQDTIVSFDYSIYRHNTLRFGEDIAPDDITLSRDNNNLVLRIAGGTDSVTIENYFERNWGPERAAIQEIRFFDGATWDRTGILSRLHPLIELDDGDNFMGGSNVDGKGGNDHLMGTYEDDVLRGGDGNDELHGLDGDDVVIGGAGDDLLDGGTGNNRFQFAAGWGHDTIVLAGFGMPLTTVIEIAGTLGGTLALSRSDNGTGNDLIIGAKGAADTVTVLGYFDPNLQQEAMGVRIEFTDHRVFDWNDIRNATIPMPPGIALTGTEGVDWLNGEGGDDRLDGGAGDDHLDGSWGNDVLLGGEGNDEMRAGSGDDLLDGGAGDDFLEGGYGNDVLLGGAGYDMLLGGDGDDILDAGAGGGVLDGGMGNNLYKIGRDAVELRIMPRPDGGDIILFNADVRPEDIVISAPGGWEFNLGIRGSAARIVVPLVFAPDGEGGMRTETVVQIKFADGTIWDSDTLLRLLYTGDDNDNQIDGSWNADSMDGRGGNDQLRGHDGNDKLRGGSGDDFLFGGMGNDVLLGQDGNDMLVGEFGDDILQGGAGDDFLDAGNGSNIIRFGLNDGVDTIFPYWDRGATHNTLEFGAGIMADAVTVRIDANSGELTLSIAGTTDKITVMHYRMAGQPDALAMVRFADGSSWSGADIARLALTGDEGVDFLVGGAGDDVIDGKGGDDVLRGLEGNDTLHGGTGNDYLDGERGNNTFIGGSGNDLMVADDGVDTYIFNRGDGADTIDEHVGPDGSNVIRFGADIKPADLLFDLAGSTLTIHYGAGDRITVNNFNAGGPEASLLFNRFEFADNSVWTYRQLSNHAPELMVPVPDLNFMEGEALDYSIPAFTFFDRDQGDVLTLELGQMMGGALPAWLSFDPLTGTISGTPGYGDSGELWLKVTARDQQGATSSDDFRLKVHHVDPAPVLGQAVATQNATEASHFQLTMAADTFVDPDGGALWYKLALADGTPLPSWLQFDPLAMTLSGTPGDADTGVLQLRLSAVDLGGQVAYTDYALNVANINQAPVLVQVIAGQAATEANGFSLTIPAATFADADGDVLSYALTLLDGALPAWLTFDSASMTLSGTPDDADTGMLQLRLTATDGGGKAVATEFTLSVANINQAPVLIQAPASQSVDDGVAFSHVLPENMFGDADAGDSGMLSVQGLPAGFSFDAQTRTISGTASLAEVGTHALTVKFTDAGGLSAAAGFALTVTAAASVTLTGTSGANTLSGKSNSDLLRGLGGDDVLNGGIGADRMEGGSGNDTFHVDNAGDVVVELSAEGIDTVMASISHTLAANVERLTLTGNGALNATGNSLNNIVTGNSGNNVINGGLGDDSMAGGLGNDTYMVGSTSDTVTEGAGAGFDRVISSVGRTLGANQEALTLTGTASVNGTGNTLSNLIQGNSGINSLNGGDGHDILQGGAGDDYLYDTSLLGNLFDGGLGNDRLIGGAGNDLLIGGAGNDTITTGTGADSVAFNRGDGIDTVATTTGSDNTVSLGNGILYGDLALAKSGSDLVLKTGMGEQISFKGWYASTPARSVGTLQVVTEGGADYVAGSTSVIHDHKVEQFDFRALVAKFDQVRVGQASGFSWNVAASLEQFSNGGSDMAAIGADLAYQYALNDSLAALSAMPALAIIGSPSFGSGQALQGGAALNDGIAVLY